MDERDTWQSDIDINIIMYLYPLRERLILQAQHLCLCTVAADAYIYNSNLYRTVKQTC